MRDVTVSWGGRIEIGRVGENQAVRVVWPELLAEWAKLYGSGTVQLAVRRPNDTAPYPAVCTVEDGTIAWVVTAADVAQAGVGECELSYLVDGVVAKSQTWKTVIRKSLTGADMAEPPDEPAKAWCEDVQSQIGDLNELETEDKSDLVKAINEARDRVYDDAGVTPVTYTYVNPLTKKDDSVTLLVREGTLTQIGDDATDAVKVAWNATMYLATYPSTYLNMPKTQMGNWVTLYRAGLISERFEYQITTAPIYRESVMYSGASQNTLTYQRTGQETVRMYYNLTTDTLESYSAFISPLKRTQKPDGTSSVPQFALAADPTADMQVATKQYVDKAAATTIVYITGSSNIGFVITIDGVEYTPREAKLLMESEPWKYLLSYENNGYFYYIGGQLGGGDNTLRYWLPNYGTSSGTYFELSERYNTITFNLGHPEKSDWETNDSESASFIRHRPFYSEPKEKSYENDALDMSETNVITLDSDELQLIKTNMYVVVWDGTRYSCMCKEMYGVLYIGNLNLYSAPFTKPDTGEPFLCYSDYSGLAIKCQTKGAHSISISYTGTVAHQLSPEYIGVRDEDAATNDEYGSGIIFARYADDTKERYVLVCPEINDIVAYIDSRREPTYVSTSIPTFSGLSDMSKSSSSIKYVPWTSSSISAKGITYRMRIYNSNNSLIDVELTNSSQNSLWGLFVNPDDVFKLYAMKIALHSDYEQLIVTVSRII